MKSHVVRNRLQASLFFVPIKSIKFIRRPFSLTSISTHTILPGPFIKKKKLLKKSAMVFLDNNIFQPSYLFDLPLKIIAITIKTTTTIKIPTPTPVLNINPIASQLLRKIEVKARAEYSRYFFIFLILVF